MNIVLLQSPFPLSDTELLIKEFPQYIFLPVSPTSYNNLSDEHWGRIEVFFGNHISDDDCKKAHQLRWIHSPSPHLNRLKIAPLIDGGSLLVSATPEENTKQIGEFVLAAILAFAKNLFHWQNGQLSPLLVWDSKWRETMWSLRGRTLLQIGLDERGSEIARKCQEMDMRVIGALPHKTLHPFCHETVSFAEAQRALPSADVVCLCLPDNKQSVNFFNQADLALIKQDAILIVLGDYHAVDINAFADHVNGGKLRGALFDCSYHTPPPPHSPLWTLPNVLVTPEIAPRPKNPEAQSFHIFLYNLRQYSHGNFKDMRYLIDLPL